MRKQSLGQEVHALEVHVEEGVDVPLGSLGERRSEVSAGIVNQVVEGRSVPFGLELDAELLGEVCERVHDAGVELQPDRGVADSSDGGHDIVRLLFVAAVGHDYVDARLCQMQRVGLPEATIAPGDDGDLLVCTHDGDPILTSVACRPVN